MAKKDTRWPMWRIAAAAAGCTVASVALFWLAVLAGSPVGEGEDDWSGPLMTVPRFMQMMASALAMLAVMALGWLIYRVRESRIPVWKRKPRKRRRKKR
ncbi:MAG TPA: hypothetical protein VM243_01475 [Phycisphaerae bacterium]|nr:hypothetical protein [Phycisphaerae bacterium]